MYLGDNLLLRGNSFCMVENYVIISFSTLAVSEILWEWKAEQQA